MLPSSRELTANQHLWSEILTPAGFYVERSQDTGKGSLTLWALEDDPSIKYLDFGDSEHLFRADDNGELSMPFEVISKYDAIRLLHFNGDANSTFDFLRSGTLLTRTIFEMVGADIRSRHSSLLDSQRYDEDPDFRTRVDKEVLRVRAIDYASKIQAEAKYAAEDKTPGALALAEFLEKPLAEEKYLINGVIPTNGTVTIVAAKKTGKSTFVYNLIASLVSGEPLLGSFTVNGFSGRVGYVNYELTEEQAQEWFRRSPITEPDRVYVWNLRGKPNPFRSDEALEEFAQELKHLKIKVLILDPFSSAFRGGNSQDNDEVKEFWLRTDWLKEKSGVSELIVPVHAGRNESRSRGASSLDDHPDAILHLNMQSDGTRTFKAFGRDVDIEEGDLEFDRLSLRLTYLGASSYETKVERIAKDVLAVLRAHGPMSAGDLTRKVARNKEDTKKAREFLVASGSVLEKSVANSKLYSLPPETIDARSPQAAAGIRAESEVASSTPL